MIRQLALALFGLWLSLAAALAQSSPNLQFGQVPTPAQWNSYFAAKADYPVSLNLSSVTGILPLGSGGTNAALVGSAGGVVYSTASALAILAGTVTAGQCLLSGSSAPPTWGSCTGGGATVSSVTGTAGQITASPTTGAVVVSLPGTITSAETFSGVITHSNATASTSTITGAIVVTGGVGVGGALNVGGAVTTPSVNSAVSGDLSGSLPSPTVAKVNGTTVPAAPSANQVLVASGPSAAAWTQVNLTNSVTGLLTLANGGTNAALTASNGGVVYSTASALAVLAGTGTPGQCLLSGASAAPTWGSCSGAAAVSSVTGTAGQVTASPTTGAVVVSLPATITPSETFSGVTTFSSATASTTTGTGAVVVSTGGVGIGGQLNVGGATSTFSAATASTTTSSGAVVVTGGVGVGGAEFVGGALHATNNTVASSPGTGSVIVSGGVGAALASFLGTATANWFSNSGGNVNYLNDRLFAGAASGNTGQSGSTVDWMSAFEAGLSSFLPNGMLGYANVAVENGTNGNNWIGITAGAQTLNLSAGSGRTALAISALGLSNNTAPLGAGSGAWAFYGECHRTVNNTGSGCVGTEAEVRNAAAGELQTDPYQAPFTSGVIVGCGAGLTSTGNPCGTAIEVSNNPETWNAGLVFLNGSLTSQSLLGGTSFEAIALAPSYALIWYSAHNTTLGGLTMTGAGAFVIATGAGGFNVNGNLGVNCAAGTVNGATITIANGIVTHC